MATDLETLRAKYEEMLRLRLLDEAGEPHDPPEAMATLASRFPGALRELDDLATDEIRARIEAIANAVGAGSVLAWMEATVRYHAIARGAFAAKRWLGKQKAIDAVTRQAFAAAVATFPHASDAAAWVDELDRVAHPPRGRVNDLVFERLARELNVAIDDARELVFPKEPRH
jgi:hypothetical protein